jgi:chemotaxis protein methyltransferase CheR
VSGDLAARFRRVLTGQLGLALEASRLGYLLELLNRRVAKHGADAHAYLDSLERPGAEGELSFLARELTIAETYFFRHAQQFDALRAILVSDYASTNKLGPSILSAGCASGEEAFSLAILLREVLPNREPCVLGIDINPTILERARAGRYSAWSLRETSEASSARWFTQSGREYIVDASIRRSVKFAQGNLATDDAALFAPRGYDIIFCRNVLMYFTPKKVREAVARLARALVPGGYLFLGSAETLRGVSQEFQLCHAHGAFYYQRPALGVAGDVEAVAPPLSGAPEDLAPTAALVPRQWVDSIARAATRVQLAAEPHPIKLPQPDEIAEQRPDLPTRSDLSVPLELLRKEQFAGALELLRALPAHASGGADVLLLEAVLLVTGGDLIEAENACIRLLALDALNAEAHYVLALCSAGAGRLEAAAHHDRVASYLDPQFAMPRLHLGLLFRRAGESSQAHAELMQARSLLAHEDPSRLLMFGGGFGRAALLAVCAAELAATREGA